MKKPAVILASVLLIALMIIAGTFFAKSMSRYVSAATETSRALKESVAGTDEVNTGKLPSGTSEGGNKMPAGEGFEGITKGEEPTNPLAGMQVKYPGSMKEDDIETATLLSFFLDQNKDVSADDILVATVDDFDFDGNYEAFIFAGEFIASEYEEYYEGMMWFTNGQDIQKLDESVGTWWSVDGFMSFDGRKYAYETMYIVTGGLSYVWSVYDGVAKEAEIDGLGSVSVDDSNEIIIISDLYDTTYDSELGCMIGHSWKPYYFFYDKDKDRIIERGGSYVAKQDIDAVSGIDLVSLIEEAGHEITCAFIRDNGLLTVNYRDLDEKGDVYFGNVNYNIDTGKYLNAWGEGEGDMEASNYGGMYLSTISSLETTYPEVNIVKEDVELTVTSYNNVMAIGNSILLSGRDGNGEWISVVVDKDTQMAPNDEALFPDREDYMTAVYWLGMLYMDERESDWAEMKVEGVYTMKVTNGHADLIEGLDSFEIDNNK